MSKYNPSIILFSVAGILYLLSIFIDSEYLTLLAKPILIPSVFVYYYIELKGKLDSLFVLSLITFFIGDMLYLINIDDYYIIGLLIFLIPYLIVLYFLIQDVLSLIKRKKINKLNLSFLIILFFLVYLITSIINILDADSDIEMVCFFLYGIVLGLMGILSALLIVNENSKLNFYIVISVSLFIISDIFFILDINLFSLLIFNLANVAAKIFSYYFYTRYFIDRQKKLKLNK